VLESTDGSVSSAGFSVSAKPKSPPRPRPEPEPRPPVELKPRDVARDAAVHAPPTTPGVIAAPPRPPSVANANQSVTPAPDTTRTLAPRDIYLPDKNTREDISDLSLPSTLPSREPKSAAIQQQEKPPKSASKVDFSSAAKSAVEVTDSSVGQYNSAAKSYLQRRSVTDPIGLSLSSGAAGDEFADLRNQVRAVTGKELNEMYEMIR
jgi:hypothetical protein